MDGFTLLAFGFCAAIASIHGQDVLDLGKVVAGECRTFAWVGDSHGNSAVIQGHDFSVSMFDGGAEVTIDGRKFRHSVAVSPVLGRAEK